MEPQNIFRKMDKTDWLRGKFVAVGDATFGDNGKGKITNFVCYYLKNILNHKVGVCVRPNGGNNAGHEVTNPWGPSGPQGSYKGHVVPMGILQGIPSLIGPGAVFNPIHLFTKELKALAEKGIDTSMLRVSWKTHLILPYYSDIDKAYEKARNKPIGTTGNGIGPAYEFKAKRVGICVADLKDTEKCKEKFQHNLKLANAVLVSNDMPAINFQDAWNQLAYYIDDLLKIAVDEQEIYRKMRENGEVGVIEMGQGTFLDIAHGTYPDVTSSATTIVGGLHGAGLSQNDLGYTILVSKGSYFTRVGNGPFPTEMSGEVAEGVRQAGNEFGTTTGRPRRCGYVDLPLLRSALELNGADCLCLTKLDITSNEPFMLVNTDYGTANGQKLSYAPNILGWQDISARVEMLPSWKSYNLAGIKNFRELPIPLQSYINFINDKLPRKNSLPVASLISIGKSLEDMVLIDNFLQKP